MTRTMKTIACLLAAPLLAAAAHAAILTVDNNPGAVAMYDNFDDAYKAASDGDTILLAGSPTQYISGISYYKKLTIIGPGYYLSENAVPGSSNLNASTAFVLLTLSQDPEIGSASGTRVYGIQGYIGVNRGVTNIRVEKCRFIAAGSDVPDSATGAPGGQISIDSCFIEDVILGGPGSVITNSIYFSA